jgi:hypothetical protein
VDSLWKRGDYSKLTEAERSALDDDLKTNKGDKYGRGAPPTGWTSALFAAVDPPVHLSMPVGVVGRRASLRPLQRQAAAAGAAADDAVGAAADDANSAGSQRRKSASTVVDELGDAVGRRTRDDDGDAAALPAGLLCFSQIRSTCPTAKQPGWMSSRHLAAQAWVHQWGKTPQRC